METRDFKKIKLLLEHGADPNFLYQDGSTPLHKFYSDQELVKLLLEYGADPNIQNEDGLTPLDIVIDTGGYDKTVKYLMENGAYPNIDSEIYSDVITRNNFSALKILLKHGVDPSLFLDSAISYRKQKMMKILLEYGANPNIQDEYGATPLHSASMLGNLKMVEILLENGADYTLKDIDGKEAIDYAKSQALIDIFYYYGNYNRPMKSAKKY